MMEACWNIWNVVKSAGKNSVTNSLFSELIAKLVNLGSIMFGFNTSTSQNSIWPVGPVTKKKTENILVRLVIVCTPSENVNAKGVTKSLKPGGRGPANVTIPDTKSLVVKGPVTSVNGFPVYWYVVGTNRGGIGN